MRKFKGRWKPTEDAKIRQLAAEGLTPDAIAIHLPHRTRIAVRFRYTHLRVNPRFDRWFRHNNPACVAEVFKFRMAGYRVSDIADIFDKKPSQVSHILTRNGIKAPYVVKMPSTHKDRWSEIEIHALRKMLKRGATLYECGRAFPMRTLRAVRKKMYRITRYWSAEDNAVRERLRQKHLKWRVY